MQRIIEDFRGLVSAILESGVSKTKLANKLSKDKATITRWEGGTRPSNSKEVADVIRAALAAGVDVGRFQRFAPNYDFSQHLTYEQKAASGAPDFDWLTGVQRPPKAERSIKGIPFGCPLGVGPSPLTGDEGWTELMLKLGFEGPTVVKTRRTRAKRSWDAPQIAFARSVPDLSHYDPSNPPEVLVSLEPEPGVAMPNIANSIGVPSESPSEWKPMYERIKRLQGGHVVGLSLMGDGNNQGEILADVAMAMAEARELAPPYVELNISCPNLEKAGHVGDDAAFAKAAAVAARKALGGSSTRLFLKLPFIPPTAMPAFLREVGGKVDGIVLRNSIRIRPVRLDRDGNKIPAFPNREFGGLSGPATFESTRLGVAAALEAREKHRQDFAIIAAGGVSTVAQAVDLLNMGVDGVQTVTAAIFDPLLAWKLRYHLHRTNATLGKHQEFEAMLLPRDSEEELCFRNAQESVASWKKRSGQQLPWAEFVHRWNEWMHDRPEPTLGSEVSFRAPILTVDQWTRVFF